jgi:hypothetical protein
MTSPLDPTTSAALTSLGAMEHKVKRDRPALQQRVSMGMPSDGPLLDPDPEDPEQAFLSAEHELMVVQISALTAAEQARLCASANEARYKALYDEARVDAERKTELFNFQQACAFASRDNRIKQLEAERAEDQKLIAELRARVASLETQSLDAVLSVNRTAYEAWRTHAHDEAVAEAYAVSVKGVRSEVAKRTPGVVVSGAVQRI